MYNKNIKYIFLSFLMFLFYFPLDAYPHISKKLNIDLDNISQNCFDYIKESSQSLKKITEYNIPLVTRNYLKRYFAPWDSPFCIISEEDLRKFLKDRIQTIRENPGWGFNKRPSSKILIEKIITKINIEQYPNIQKKGIIIKNTYLRSIPCITPHFKDWTTPGQGFPFDNYQISYLHAFQPIYIIHKDKKRDWAFVITNQYSVGWIQSKDIAFVDEQFIRSWKKNKYIIPLNDDIGIYNKNFNRYLISSRIGQLLPFLKETNDNYEVLTCDIKDNGYAKIINSKIAKLNSKPFPLTLTESNISKQINILMNKPYGWGGLFGFRDCTELLRDIFGTFALFLPRNSRWQKESGSKIYLGNLSDEEKAKLIIKRGIPFMTLVYYPGHIMLYIGQKNGVPYVFNTIWALKTKDLFKGEDRAIIGKSLIMPLNIGEKYKSVKQTPLTKLTYMILLNDNLLYPKLFESQTYSGINQLDLIEEAMNRKLFESKLKKYPLIRKIYEAYEKYIKDIIFDNGDIIFYMKNGSKISTKEMKIPLELKNYIPQNIENNIFFNYIYGKNDQEINKNLVKINWMPKSNNSSKYVYFNKNAGAAPALIRISHQLDKLSDNKKYVLNVELNKENNYGITIKLKKFYISSIPKEIIKIFEQNDFIWLGRWNSSYINYFEYRPEFFRK
ncbi:MAG: hypothetical protein GY830_08040 [Bacteroidetes bacterium]|nr:hypothetical protein [Bacteroidota bacterium]